jgi:hypothetical protein
MAVPTITAWINHLPRWPWKAREGNIPFARTKPLANHRTRNAVGGASQPAKPNETALRNHYRHTSCQGCFTVARPNMLACHMHRGQGGGTRRVQCDARSAQIEAIGNAVGSNAMRCAGRRVRTDAVGVPRAALDDLVVIMRNPNEQRKSVPALNQHNAHLHRLRTVSKRSRCCGST